MKSKSQVWLASLGKFSRGWQSLAYYLFLFVCWGFWLHWSTDRFGPTQIGLAALAEELLVKNLVWLLPAFLLIFFGKTELCWPIRDLLETKIYLPMVFICCCAMVAAFHTLWLCVTGGTAVILPFNLMCLPLAFCTGFTEELIFRGFLLNNQLTHWPKLCAVVLNGILFVCIHYTGILFGDAIISLFSLRSLVLFFLSITFSGILIKTRSLKTAMLLHAFWNCLAFFYGLY